MTTDDPVTRPDLDEVRAKCCQARKDRAGQVAAFGDPLRVVCPKCNAKVTRPCFELKAASPYYNNVNMHSNLGLEVCSKDDPRSCDCSGFCPCHRTDTRVEEALAAARKKHAEQHTQDVATGLKNPCKPGACEYGTCR